MTYVVTARCVDCRYTYCAVPCPCDCFWEIQADEKARGLEVPEPSGAS